MKKKRIIKIGFEERKKTPYIGFGNEQLKNAPKVPNKVPCYKCGKLCKVESSKPDGTLQFISCCGSTWLVGINDKLIEHIKPKVSGEL